MSRFSFQFFTPLILLGLMLVDGHITQALSNTDMTVTSSLFLIFLTYSILQHSYRYMVLIAFIIGVIYDSYYIGVYGIASLLFPLIVLFVYNIRQTVFENRLTRIFTVIIIVTAFEFFSAAIMLLFQLATFNFGNYIIYEMAPSLILNVTFAILLQFPLEKMYGMTKRKRTLQPYKKM
ncbi:MAG: rod shape-determining protein MreD [Lactococcus sp.]|uniref:Rod shape-determining protein MreD n=1 Tax=Pseudolactococcus piscium MKFS47 TaxID=297352 RepID=A0A0D6DZQ6_9LACT|nr:MULTISPECIES: rod shape-determining protein MreD [Lactococcus]MCJ1971760.1 rod shape-determining protein MreD [Lactococcus carnosus]MBR6894731.1 rod shape-determining protein MreD [Lactococcus sp.]MDN5403514.1 rod shape-determining protein MreD [Lactococcus sp.]MDN5409223.1 rod shape-determining protein MreD [Lactococcus sp.]MDN5411988.1 rod shape-determining protein MreD [Lactococcus sp.]